MMADTRVVTISGLPCPCGGTHVQQLGEIEGLEVLRIKKNKKAVKVYYTVAGLALLSPGEPES